MPFTKNMSTAVLSLTSVLESRLVRMAVRSCSDVKSIGPSIVPAIPEAASQSGGRVLLRLQGVDARFRNLARVLVVVRVEQL